MIRETAVKVVMVDAVIVLAALILAAWIPYRVGTWISDMVEEDDE